MKREVDLVVISDVHLGTYGSHARELYCYLKQLKVGTLVLNGDFIDMGSFRRRYFPREHLLVIQRILRMAAKGTTVYYITGNHDDLLRQYTDFSSGLIHLRDKLVIQLNGKRYWFFHGDIFDTAIQYSPLLIKIGGKSYDYLVWLNRLINRLRRAAGYSRMSFAARIKHSVRGAVKFIERFEDMAMETAARQGYDYVVCGHIHRPMQRTQTVAGQPITYLNSGDWVENLTALEYCSGSWSIYQYSDLDHDIISRHLTTPDQRDIVLAEDRYQESKRQQPQLSSLLKKTNVVP